MQHFKSVTQLREQNVCLVSFRHPEPPNFNLLLTAFKECHADSRKPRSGLYLALP